ncbi:MAG: exo-alpha-sialidase, partial [Desulfobacteraceae bacterium]|nr:exo-alpha-sialidase [Desulfobacteraceae bacterium]
GSIPGEILQVPDGRVAAVWLQRYPHDKAEIRVRISNDEGRTWSRKTYSLMKGNGYPSSVVYPDGTIVTVCENTKMDAAGQPRGRRTMAAARWRMPV